MTTVRGKLVTIGDQHRFFPAVSRNPMGACDSALEHEREDDDERDGDGDLEREEALDARECAVDMREAAKDEGKEDKAAKDRKRARDARAIARDRRAYDRRVHGAGDAAGGPDNPAVDSRHGMALDRTARMRAAHCPDIPEIFGTTAHAARNAQA